MSEPPADEVARSGRALAPHPAALPRSAIDLRGTVTAHRDRLAFAFELRGEVAALALPRASRAPGRVARLWEHTCFEAFVAPEDGTQYVELNVSPSRDWALWAFDRYRTGMRPAALGGAPEVVVDRHAGIVRVAASVPVSDLSAVLGAPPVRVGLAAVIEEKAGRLSYWACRHPSERPDFHHRDGWPIAVYARAGA